MARLKITPPVSSQFFEHIPEQPINHTTTQHQEQLTTLYLDRIRKGDTHNLVYPRGFESRPAANIRGVIKNIDDYYFFEFPPNNQYRVQLLIQAEDPDGHTYQTSKLLKTTL